MKKRAKDRLFGIGSTFLLLAFAAPAMPQQLVHAKVAIQVVSNGKVTTARSKDKLAKGDKLRLYIEPQEEMFLYVVHTDQNATGLLAKTNTSATAASELVVLPSESEYYEIDGNSSFEQITIICAKKRQSKIESLFSENAPSLAAWQETELALLQQYQIDLNESTDKPFGIAGNVRNLGDESSSIIEQMIMYSGKSMVIKRYEFRVKK